MRASSVTVYLGLGANLGDREGNIRRAIEFMQPEVAVNRVSSLYETTPVGLTAQPDFLNIACCGQTVLTPEALLAFCKGIEASLGRLPSFPNAPRLIDIDILIFEDTVIDQTGLRVPHPRMTDRAFVMVPLVEIASTLRHPVLSRTMAELLADLDTDGVRTYHGDGANSSG